MPTQDPYDLPEPGDFEPVRRPRWMVPAAWLCLLAAVLLIVLSI